MTRKPTQAQVQEQAAKAARGPVKVAQPAWVLSFDRTTQTAAIQIATAYRVQNDAGKMVLRARPPIPNVPVSFAGSVTWDLEEGEWGLAIICDRSIDEWKATANQSVEPRDPRRFDVTDAVFMPGVQTPASPLPAAAFANSAVVLYDRGTGDVRLGDSTASDYVALDSLVQGVFSLVKAWLDLHVHTGGTLFGGLTGPPQNPSPSATNTAATKVKAV